MKILALIALVSALTNSAFATIETGITNEQYTCIADSLQAINSDIYYNLSSTDIDSMLQIPEFFGHIDAMNAAKRCGAIK